MLYTTASKVHVIHQCPVCFVPAEVMFPGSFTISLVRVVHLDRHCRKCPAACFVLPPEVILPPALQNNQPKVVMQRKPDHVFHIS